MLGTSKNVPNLYKQLLLLVILLNLQNKFVFFFN